MCGFGVCSKVVTMRRTQNAKQRTGWTEPPHDMLHVESMFKALQRIDGLHSITRILLNKYSGNLHILSFSHLGLPLAAGCNPRVLTSIQFKRGPPHRIALHGRCSEVAGVQCLGVTGRAPEGQQNGKQHKPMPSADPNQKHELHRSRESRQGGGGATSN